MRNENLPDQNGAADSTRQASSALYGARGCQFKWVQFPILIVDVDERGNRVRDQPISRTCASKKRARRSRSDRTQLRAARALETRATEEAQTSTALLTFTPVNDAPVATDSMVSLEQDTATRLTLAATDRDSETLTYTIVSGPAHGELDGTAPDLVYDPERFCFGDDSITFTVSDGTSDSEEATVTFTIEHVITCGDGMVEEHEACGRSESWCCARESPYVCCRCPPQGSLLYHREKRKPRGFQ